MEAPASTCQVCRGRHGDLLTLRRLGDDESIAVCRRCLEARARILVHKPNRYLEPHVDPIAEGFDEPVWESDELVAVLPRDVVQASGINLP